MPRPSNYTMTINLRAQSTPQSYSLQPGFGPYGLSRLPESKITVTQLRGILCAG
ncbi:hypothetical protein DPMN_117544 [Dreissena polymorpha]|uniref:Uncharacterized protein n=1 Tax=Dreissena polymorpha TaxID=45954 RepID=A0A9D4QV04_DREPO|nr:hypothetical protein DPMN_117544 [Dreissena polymorpha]